VFKFRLPYNAISTAQRLKLKV